MNERLPQLHCAIQSYTAPSNAIKRALSWAALNSTARCLHKETPCMKKGNRTQYSPLLTSHIEVLLSIALPASHIPQATGLGKVQPSDETPTNRSRRETPLSHADPRSHAIRKVATSPGTSHRLRHCRHR